MAYFHFSHYKSMQVAIATKIGEQQQQIITIYVEVNTINIYAKFQLHPPYDFWEEDFWIFILKM